jgi:hypothetical protein
VVAHDGEVALALLVLDLIDRHGDEPVEEIDPLEGFGGDAHAHVVHRPPRHLVAVRGSLLVADDRVVHDEVLERLGEGRVVPRPRHRRDRRAVLGTVHPRCVGDQLTGGEPDIDVSPATLAAALVVERCTLVTATTTAASPRLAAQPHLEARPVTVMQFPSSDHRLAVQPEHRHEYLLDAHAVLSSSPAFEQPET